MQLSTRTSDYLVDTLTLRDQIGPALAATFADPAIVKVRIHQHHVMPVQVQVVIFDTLVIVSLVGSVGAEMR